MNTRKSLVLLAAAIIIILASGCKTIKSLKIVRQAEFAGSHFKTVIPFEERFNLISVKAGINGGAMDKEFIFDTGAGATLISKALADQLHLKVESSIPTRGAFDQVSKNDVVIIPELNINGLVFKNVGAVVADFGPNSAINCVGKDGIIGANVFNRCDWIVDYKKHELTATDDSIWFSKDEAIIPFSGASPRISATIGHTVFKNLMVDLGSGEFVTLPIESVTSHPALFPAGKAYKKFDAATSGLNGSYSDSVYTYNMDSFAVGGKTYQHVILTAGKKYYPKVGASFFNKNMVGFDFKKHMMYVDGNNTNLDPTWLRGFGLVLNLDQGKCTVIGLSSFSPAGDAGIKMGDEILEIDGKPVQETFKTYCDFAFWQKNYFTSAEKISFKIKGRNEPVAMQRAAYRLKQ